MALTPDEHTEVYEAIISAKDLNAVGFPGDQYGNPGGGDVAKLQARIHRLADAVEARVLLEAPDAPRGVQIEATIRAAGYLWTTETIGGFGVLRAVERAVNTHGSLNAAMAAEIAPIFLRSGARAILKPWASRGAGVIG